MRRSLTLAACLAVLAACQQPAQTPKMDSGKAPVAAPAAPSLPIGVFTVTGEVTKVEDAGYPMFHVIVTPASGAPVEMLWMAEDDSVKVAPEDAQPASFQGKQVEVSFSRVASFSLAEISRDGKALLQREPGEGFAMPANVKTITGVLSGPDQLTAGDLPDELTVKDSTGAVVTVQHFIIEDAILKAVGKTVTMSYTDDQDTNLTGIRLLAPAAKK